MMKVLIHQEDIKIIHICPSNSRVLKCIKYCQTKHRVPAGNGFCSLNSELGASGSPSYYFVTIHQSGLAGRKVCGVRKLAVDFHRPNVKVLLLVPVMLDVISITETVMGHTRHWYVVIDLAKAFFMYSLVARGSELMCVPMYTFTIHIYIYKISIPLQCAASKWDWTFDKPRVQWATGLNKAQGPTQQVQF